RARSNRLQGGGRVFSRIVLLSCVGVTIPWVLGCPLLSPLPIPLKIVNVSAPDINCKFDEDCTITVDDFSDHFVLPAHGGDAFLQSRRFPIGESGTAAEGLYGYQYRLDLRELMGLTALGCITSLTIDFGSVVSLDYDDDGTLDQVYVVTTGGLGSVVPTSAIRTGGTITFSFSPGVCAGGSPGSGESTYFFGLTSTNSSHAVVAQVEDTLGSVLDLDARAPQP
ncbi:MAG: hypothetical protein PVI86_20215, partial [Phycisphaerae bacterium]